MMPRHDPADPDATRRSAAQAVEIRPGSPLSLGVSEEGCDGFNFAVFSRHAERVELLLYDLVEAAIPTLVLDLDPVRHRTGDVWHVFVGGIGWGQSFAWRVHGPWAPRQGHLFDARLQLLDPYATAVVETGASDIARLTRRSEAAADQRGAALPAVRSLLVDGRFDWQGVERPRRPWSETVIYETHVRGLTIHPSSGVRAAGGFLGLIEKIPYFRDLGITALELMPVQEFNSRDAGRTNPETGIPLANYWGYDTAAFFAPKESYGSGSTPGCQVAEFKTMVRELHRAGIEVILDVVFNHTAEGGEDGPTSSFRGFDNAIYYLLDPDGGYLNYSGCGNTVNCNHPVVRDTIIACLRTWVAEMHVDGFRFDLASILGRGAGGQLLDNPPLLERIAEDPLLRDAKLIAEAWDAGGAFQVGRFPGQRWAEWNCHFRDDVRRFWRGDPGLRGAFASRLCGSADLYQHGKSPLGSINFVTSHDGFTLNDLVSYGGKHNEANGENNRDGPGQEFSANHGVEGETGDPAIKRIRLRQIRNMLATLLLSRGVPMILGGDEFRRTQRGNSNAWCQDNEVSWYDWRFADGNAGLVRFVRDLIDIRRRFPALRSDSFYTDSEVDWFDRDGLAPDWGGRGATLGMMIHPARSEPQDESTLCLMFNAGDEPAHFTLPASPDGGWRRVLDTARCAPDDVAILETQERFPPSHGCRLAPHSMVLLQGVRVGRSQAPPSNMAGDTNPEDRREP